jgi:hypothetical protein
VKTHPNQPRSNALPPRPSIQQAARFGCAGCDNRWSGYRICHCGACHESFGGLVAFDRHRQGTFGTRHCVDPASVGLRRGANGQWTTTAPAEVLNFLATFNSQP